MKIEGRKSSGFSGICNGGSAAAAPAVPSGGAASVRHHQPPVVRQRVAVAAAVAGAGAGAGPEYQPARVPEGQQAAGQQRQIERRGAP